VSVSLGMRLFELHWGGVGRYLFDMYFEVHFVILVVHII
jgi:hypothetical protein